MRIIAGEWRGRRLLAPKGDATRPTADRTRETLFSMLDARLGGFEGLVVADIFAGSGALGLEALSRGAGQALFVEDNAAACATLRANIATLAAGPRAVLHPRSALTLKGKVARCCDLVLLDPPYRTGLAAPALARLFDLGWISAGAWIALETAADEVFDPATLAHDAAANLAVMAERRVGKARLTLLRVAEV